MHCRHSFVKARSRTFIRLMQASAADPTSPTPHQMPARFPILGDSSARSVASAWKWGQACKEPVAARSSGMLRQERWEAARIHGIPLHARRGRCRPRCRTYLLPVVVDRGCRLDSQGLGLERKSALCVALCKQRSDDRAERCGFLARSLATKRVHCRACGCSGSRSSSEPNTQYGGGEMARLLGASPSCPLCTPFFAALQRTSRSCLMRQETHLAAS